MAGVAAFRAVDDSGGGDISGEDTLMAMLILALDTTTRAGSVALMRDNELLSSVTGDLKRTHGERLPGDLLRSLDGAGLSVQEVDLFAVCSGPGSFTGLRVGLATIQALALTTQKLVAPVSTLEALAYASIKESGSVNAGTLIVPWINAYRGEVYASVYLLKPDGAVEELRSPLVGTGSGILENWKSLLNDRPSVFIGDAVSHSKSIIKCLVQGPILKCEVPRLAPVIARRAFILGESGSIRPHAVRPVYVRRPDAELARERAERSIEK